MLTSSIFLIFATFLSEIYAVFGDDPFESLNVRLNCYKTTQKGCKRDLIDAYPEVRWSYTNTTKADTHFYLFTKRNPDDPELIHKCAGRLPPCSKFDPRCRTEFLIHGWVHGVCNIAIFRELKNEILKRKSCANVIAVDYTWGNSLDLVEAKNNLPIVAKQIAIVIRNLKRRFHLGPEKFMLIGHSLGAQVCGLVGHQERIGRIVGLDPAGIVYTKDTPLADRLDAGDADCVEVIHCNGGQCIPNLGCDFNCGTIDFWVNGGLYQPLPSCYHAIPEAFLKGDFFWGIQYLDPKACYHNQCIPYYKASINPTVCQFVGVECDSYADFQAGKCNNCGKCGQKCAVMGAYTCDCLSSYRRKRKSYYLNTDPTCPYCNNSGINLGGFKCAVGGI